MIMNMNRKVNVKQLIEEMNKQNIREDNPKIRKKKKEDVIEENSDTEKKSTKDDQEENVQKKAKIPSTSTSTYLHRPGPGAGASSRSLATPGWQHNVGNQSSSSSSSPGKHTTFANIQLNMTESFDSVIAANSCSTAADISATVLAGNFELHTGREDDSDGLEKSENKKVSIAEKLGPNLAADHHPEGVNIHTTSSNITPSAS